MLLTDAWHELFPHYEQSVLMLCPKRFKIIAAGRGAGKTDISLRRLIVSLALKKPWGDPRYFYIGPTREQAKRIAWERLKALTPPEWITKIQETELSIHTIFGSYVQVVGFDKPQRVEGVQWDGGVIDENSDIKPGSFDKNIYPALTHRRGWCWREGACKRQGLGAKEFRKLFFAAKRGALKDTSAHTWTSEGILPPEEIQDAQDRLDPVTYREQFRAEWQDATGKVHHQFDRDFHVRPCNYQPDLPICVGCDFNVDPMAWVLGHDYGNRIEVFSELWLRDTNTPKSLDVLWNQWMNHPGGWCFYGDATGTARNSKADRSDYQHIVADTRFDQFRDKEVNWPENNPSKSDRFASVNAMLKNGMGRIRLHIDPRCEQLIDDLEARVYKEGSREVADHDDIGHITDALGYWVYFEYPVGWDVTVPGVHRIGHMAVG